MSKTTNVVKTVAKKGLDVDAQISALAELSRNKIMELDAEIAEREAEKVKLKNWLKTFEKGLTN